MNVALRELERLRHDSGWRPKAAGALSPAHAELLMLAADQDGARSSALISLMLYTGARVGELESANVADLYDDAGTTMLQIAGTGRKQRSLPIIAAVLTRLDRYLGSRPLAVPLFATSTGKRLDPTQVRRILLRCAERAGLDPVVVGQLTPHSTRATYATGSLAAGASLRDLQYALGHEDPRTTEGYDRSMLQLDGHPSSRLAALLKPPELAD